MAAAIVLMAFGAMFSPLSDAGAGAAQRWKRFATHLRDMAHSRASLPSLSEWEKVLAYAAALGVAIPLLRRGQREGSLPAPAWFGVWQNQAQDDAFASFMNTSGASASGGGASGAG